MRYGDILRQGRHLVVQHWRPMLSYASVIWLANALLLMPLLTWIFRTLAKHGDVIVSNYSIHFWLMTPRGLACALLVGGIGALTTVLHVAGTLEICRAALEGRRLRGIDAVRSVLLRLHGLFRVSVMFFLLCLPAIAVGAIGPGLAYLVLLGKHDINYYLTHHPPVWYVTIALSVLWLIPVVFTWGFILIRRIYALPAWLDGVHSLRKAFRDSWAATRHSCWLLVRILFSWLAIWGVAWLLFEGILFSVSGFLLSRFADSIEGVISIVTAYLIIMTLGRFVVLFFGLSWGTSMWALCYRYDFCQDEKSRQQEEISIKQAGRLRLIRQLLRPRIILPVAAVLFLSNAALSHWMLGHEVTISKPMVIAHRAGAADAPENTLAAMDVLLKADVTDIVEIDVTITLDGQLVIAHDKDLMKQAGDPRVIRETAYADFSDVDTGVQFHPDFKGERLALLQEFLEKAKSKKRMILEFKHGHETNLVERSILAVRDADMADEVIFMSLDLAEVRKVQKLAPEIKVGYFASLQVGDMTELEIDVIGAKDGMVTAKFVEDLHEQGIAIYAWTVDDPARIIELIEAGVDGIITNDPSLARNIVDKVAALPASIRVLLRFRRFWLLFKELGWWDGSHSS